MSNQDNINSFLDSMDNFDSTPAEEAPTTQSVLFAPAAVWPGEEPAQQTAAAAPVQAEPVPAAPPTAQPAAPQEVIPTPVPAVQTTQTPQAAPPTEQQVAPQTQPIVQQQQVVPQQQPVVQQPVMQQAAPDPAPVQQPMLDQFDTVMQNLEVQGEKRMIEALVLQLLPRNRRFLRSDRISVLKIHRYIYGNRVPGLSAAEACIRL